LIGGKITCNNPAHSKCLFVTWLASPNRLATCDRLLKESETHSHLFFVCVTLLMLFEKVQHNGGIQVLILVIGKQLFNMFKVIGTGIIAFTKGIKCY